MLALFYPRSDSRNRRKIDDVRYLREETYLWAANDTEELDPIIQTRRSIYVCVYIYMSGSCGRRKKKKKKIRRAHILLPPYSSLSVSTLCLYISKFDIDSPPGIGQTLFLVWRGEKNVISRMNNLTSTLFFRLLPSFRRSPPRFSPRDIECIGFIVVGNSEIRCWNASPLPVFPRKHALIFIASPRDTV